MLIAIFKFLFSAYLPCMNVEEFYEKMKELYKTNLKAFFDALEVRYGVLTNIVLYGVLVDIPKRSWIKEAAISYLYYESRIELLLHKEKLETDKGIEQVKKILTEGDLDKEYEELVKTFTQFAGRT